MEQSKILIELNKKTEELESLIRFCENNQGCYNEDIKSKITTLRNEISYLNNLYNKQKQSNQNFIQNNKYNQNYNRYNQNKNTNTEKILGQKILSVIASLFIFISLILFSVAIIPHLNDILKVVLFTLFSLVLTVIPESIVQLFKKLQKQLIIEQFLEILSTCGVCCLNITLLLGTMYFKIINIYVFLLLMIVIMVITLLLGTIQKHDITYTIISQLEIVISTIYCAFLGVKEQNLSIMFMTVLYLLSMELILIFLKKKSLLNYHNNSINLEIIVSKTLICLITLMSNGLYSLADFTTINLNTVYIVITTIVIITSLITLDLTSNYITNKKTIPSIISSYINILIIQLLFSNYHNNIDNKTILYLLLTIIIFVTYKLNKINTKSITKYTITELSNNIKINIIAYTILNVLITYKYLSFEISILSILVNILLTLYVMITLEDKWNKFIALTSINTILFIIMFNEQPLILTMISLVIILIALIICYIKLKSDLENKSTDKEESREEKYKTLTIYHISYLFSFVFMSIKGLETLHSYLENLIKTTNTNNILNEIMFNQGRTFSTNKLLNTFTYSIMLTMIMMIITISKNYDRYLKLKIDTNYINNSILNNLNKSEESTLLKLSYNVIYYISVFLMLLLLLIQCKLFKYSIVLKILGALMITVVTLTNTMDYLTESNKTYTNLLATIKLQIGLWLILAMFSIKLIVFSSINLIFALMLITIGFVKNKKTIRIYGLISTLFMCVKLLLFDIQSDSVIALALGFLASGIICFGISLVYYMIDKKLENKLN